MGISRYKEVVKMIYYFVFISLIMDHCLDSVQQLFILRTLNFIHP